MATMTRWVRKSIVVKQTQPRIGLHPDYIDAHPTTGRPAPAGSVRSHHTAAALLKHAGHILTPALFFLAIALT
jgi:hypothetical protein